MSLLSWSTAAIVGGIAIPALLLLYFLKLRRMERKVSSTLLWKKAVEKTGGRFYAVSNEASLLRAIRDIDRLAAGTIQVKRYTTQQPEFGVFALLAAGLWSAAAAVKLSSSRFQSLP